MGKGINHFFNDFVLHNKDEYRDDGVLKATYRTARDGQREYNKGYHRESERLQRQGGRYRAQAANGWVYEAQGEARESRRHNLLVGRNNYRFENETYLARYDESYLDGLDRGARRHGNSHGRAAADGIFAGQTPGIFPDTVEHRQGRYGSGTYGIPTSEALDASAVQFYTKDDQFVIYNLDAQGRPVPLDLTPQQQLNFEKALYAIDHDKRDGRGLSDNVDPNADFPPNASGADALRYMLANGLSPYAVIVDNENANNLKEHTLSSFVEWQMSDKNKSDSLKMLKQHRASYRSPAEELYDGLPTVQHQVTSLQPRFGADVTIDVSKPADGPDAIREIEGLVNARQVLNKQGQILSPEVRLHRIDHLLQNLNTEEEAQAFHAALAQSPNFHANLSALTREAANQGADATLLESLTLHMAAKTVEAAKLDPEGAKKAERVVGFGAEQNPGYGNFQQYNGLRLSSEELSQVSIENAELQAKLQAAIDSQKQWDVIAQENPIAGLIINLFRPLLTALNPDSDPMHVLEQAAQKGIQIHAGTAEIAEKISQLSDHAKIGITTGSIASEAGVGGPQASTPSGQATGADGASHQEAMRALMAKASTIAQARADGAVVQGKFTAPQTVDVSVHPSLSELDSLLNAGMVTDRNTGGTMVAIERLERIQVILQEAAGKNDPETLQALQEGLNNPNFMANLLVLEDVAKQHGQAPRMGGIAGALGAIADKNDGLFERVDKALDEAGGHTLQALEAIAVERELANSPLGAGAGAGAHPVMVLAASEKEQAQGLLNAAVADLEQLVPARGQEYDGKISDAEAQVMEDEATRPLPVADPNYKGALKGKLEAVVEAAIAANVDEKGAVVDTTNGSLTDKEKTDIKALMAKNPELSAAIHKDIQAALGGQMQLLQVADVKLDDLGIAAASQARTADETARAV